MACPKYVFGVFTYLVRNKLETNRIEASKIANAKDREAMTAIANDPSKAYDYGKDNNWIPKKKIAKGWGFKKFTFFHKIPHESLFSRVNNGYNYQNISDSGIETLIEILNKRFQMFT